MWPEHDTSDRNEFTSVTEILNRRDSSDFEQLPSNFQPKMTKSFSNYEESPLLGNYNQYNINR